MQNQHRQLAAILFTDIVGYTALMQENEQKAVALIKHYNTALNELVALHNGKVLNYYGDGSLCTFPSVTEALNCAIELQKELQAAPTVPLRIGLHVGEVFFENEKALGDGVNVASRIQSLGQANTILFSKEIFDKIRNQPEFKSVSLGLFEFKNVNQPMEVFALANEGLNVPKKETLEGKLKKPLSKNNNPVRKKIIITVSIVLALIAGFFIYSAFLKKMGFTGKEKSIAVLPFESMNSDKETESFSMGISTEITNQLQKISSLNVRASTSTIRFKGEKNKTFKDIAAELNVAALVTGQFQIESNKIRVYVELTDVNSDKVIWSKDYPSDWKDIFSIQNEIAEQVAFELNAEMTKDEKKKIEKKPTNNPEAYNYYLQGLQLHNSFWETKKQEYFDNSRTMFEKALTLDSNYALAHAALADLYNTFSKEDSLFISLQLKEIEKAWRIDSTNDYVNNVKGVIEQTIKGNKELAFKYLRRSVEINPNNSENLWNLAMLVGIDFGLIDQSKLLFNRSAELNPLSASSFGGRGVCDYFLGNYENALKDLETAFRLEPDYVGSLDLSAVIYASMGKLGDAQKMLDKSLQIIPSSAGHWPPDIAYIYAKLGNKKKALELTAVDWRVLLASGMKEDALKAIDINRGPGIGAHYLILKNLLATSDFDQVRTDPRFLELMEKKRIQYEENKKKFNVADLLH